jgi:hypothetical protein
MDKRLKKNSSEIEKKKLNPDKFVRYSEGAQMYHILYRNLCNSLKMQKLVIN